MVGQPGFWGRGDQSNPHRAWGPVPGVVLEPCEHLCYFGVAISLLFVIGLARASSVLRVCSFWMEGVPSMHSLLVVIRDPSYPLQF